MQDENANANRKQALLSAERIAQSAMNGGLHGAAAAKPENGLQNPCLRQLP